MSKLTTSSAERIENISDDKKISNNIEAARFKPYTTSEEKIDETKAEKKKNIDSLNMKISVITSTKPTLYFEQPSADLMKRSLLKPPGKYSHASQFTNYLYSLNHQVATLLQIKITGCHFICMITIPINKQHLANIQINTRDKP